MESEDRHSEALEVELVADPEEKARQEAKNGLRQFDDVVEQIEYCFNLSEDPSNYVLPQSLLLTAERLKV